ncbi:hypothetical protein [Pseudomonas khavaziana]|uniref:hypothetical protein n=1 Tax=Pseudomonas khavaziana TaxID=2842351 RepID=UPI001C3CC637|nr:hypothetical protein [Pseudomonas khavaziana]MBV4481324.1 hypothetical protein [Pseudomonas khavaziana]
MTNTKGKNNDPKNPTNGTFTAQLVRGPVILDYRADEISLRKTAFRYILDTTMRGNNTIYLEFRFPLGITGNRDKYTIRNPDGPVTATCELKYATDPEPLSFDAISGQITFYEFNTSTGKVHARFYMVAVGRNGDQLELNSGEMQLVGIGL